MPQIIDLSVLMEEKSMEPAPMSMKKVLHGPGANVISKKMLFARKKGLFQKLKAAITYYSGKWPLKPESFPQREFLSNELVSATTHTGTHLDAPWHYGSRCEGKPSRQIADVPLELCFGNGVVLDMTHKEPGSSIGKQDVEEALTKIGRCVGPGDIVLIRTGFDKKWGTPAYFAAHPGMGRDATEYLVECGVKVMGIDAYGFDRPFGRMVADYIRTGDSSYLWPSHFYGREKEYFHMERLANLDQIPKPHGFKVACFPIKIKDAGAAWVRAVAIIEEKNEIK